MPHSVHTTSTPPDPTVEVSIGQRYWNNNVPESRWTAKCPDFLLGISEKNVAILSGSQAEYQVVTWPECQALVAANHIDHFQRSPLELRRYIAYMFKLKKAYGSVMDFVQNERLKWKTVSPSGDALFSNPEDYRILYNDWPYGIDPEITHLVVWTKFLLEEDDATGFLTNDCHDLIEAFVRRTFCGENGVARTDLVWFKNWKSLKSVHALEHFHVMLHRPSPEFLRRVTNGDKPMSELVGDE